MPLEAELAYFESIKDDLLTHREGKFALIVGAELLGAFDSNEAAYTAGLEKRGNVPMLIQPIPREEPTESMPAVTLGLMGARL